MTIFEIFTDGAASGNPGPAAIGVVIKQNGQTVFELSRSIGCATNNAAEYQAVIAAIEESIKRQAQEITINTDSELLFRQLTGKYQVKNEALSVLFEQVRSLAKGVKKIEMRHIPREQNKEADRLAKQGIQKQQAKVVASPLFGGGEESPGSKG